ncbi:MAG: LuxR C-terminal-related transcriptional regulator [Planctomycetota bacterium]
MPVKANTIEDLADCYTFVVDPDGTCILHPRVPETEGQKPWDWCIEEDRAKCREAFVQACMFRKPQDGFEMRVMHEGRVLRLRLRLYPLDSEGARTGQVLCLFQRVFEGELTKRERHVLALVAGGADTSQVAEVLGITASTARDHVARIKKKLSIHHPEGFRLAAHHFGLAGTATGLDGGD